MRSWLLLLGMSWALGLGLDVGAQPPPNVCFADERVWVPGRWVQRHGRSVWQDGFWEVRRVRVPCPPPPCPPPPPPRWDDRHDPRWDDRHDPRWDDRRGDRRRPRDPYGGFVPPVIRPDEFAAALNSIRSRGFEDTRLTLAQQIVASNWLTTVQVRELMAVFSFEQSRVALAKSAWHRVVDPQQFYLVNEAFAFDNSTRELDRYIRSNPR